MILECKLTSKLPSLLTRLKNQNFPYFHGNFCSKIWSPKQSLRLDITSVYLVKPGSNYIQLENNRRARITVVWTRSLNVVRRIQKFRSISLYIKSTKISNSFYFGWVYAMSAKLSARITSILQVKPKNLFFEAKASFESHWSIALLMFLSSHQYCLYFYKHGGN